MVVVDKMVSAGRDLVAGAMDTAVEAVPAAEAVPVVEVAPVAEVEVVTDCVRESGTGWHAD